MKGWGEFVVLHTLSLHTYKGGFRDEGNGIKAPFKETAVAEIEAGGTL